MVAISLILHLVLLGLPRPMSGPPDKPPGRAITLALEPAPVTESVPPPSISSIPQSEPDPARTPVPASEEPVEPEPKPEPERAPSNATATVELRQQVLEATRHITAEREPDERSDTMSFASVPTLPGRTGWLNNHVGTVRTSIDRWHGNDGSSHSRSVLANGRVICTHIHAPTIREHFNPSMSAAVVMVRPCGRERPEPGDSTDPWRSQ